MATKNRAAKREMDAEDGVRMVKVKCLLDRPYATWDDGNGPRRIKNGDIIRVPEDMLSERWMEPMEKVDWDLSRKRRESAKQVVMQKVIRGRRQDADTEKMMFGGNEDPRYPGTAIEPPAPMQVL